MGKIRKPPAERLAIIARQEVGAGVVKSAGRVLQILEFFDDIQRPATVVELSETLNYPQSSTSALLRSLVTLGYLKHDPYARTYVTSSRVALLGNWVNAEFVREGAVIRLMKELNQRTGDTVVLATRNGLQCQYIHVIQATSPARLHMTLGTVRPLAASGAGYALLSALSDAEITRLVMRVNADARPDDRLVRLSELLPQLEDIRQLGYAFTCNMVTRGGGILAAPLPQKPGENLLVVGIGGISEVMLSRKEELIGILRECIDKHFGSGEGALLESAA
jgi:DNA-binding IclR family transcriptional regulator